MTNPNPSLSSNDPSAENPGGGPPANTPLRGGPKARTVILGTLALALAFALGILWGDEIAGAVRSLWSGSRDDSAEPTADDGGTYYTCGMHPWVILPRPGTCPVCRMELTPIDPAKFTGDVVIDPRIVQNIGVRIDPVVTGPLVRKVRTVGSVTYDETRVRDVNTKVSGWIEEIHVDYLGARVDKGDPLFELFSRDLYDTQQQYLLSLQGRSGREPEFLQGASGDRERLLESSRLRLEYYDITPDQIAELEKRGRPSKTMTIVSPHAGVVISKHANEGMLVDPGMLVYRIADLSKVWVIATLYEYQLPFISVGQRAEMTLPYIPGARFEGKVLYVYPFLDKKSREVQVRLAFDNPDLLLKPGMFVNVELESVLAEDRVLAPRSAVIDTGEREVAFVSLGEGRFEPRDVRTGIETSAGLVEVLDGLRPGELVVTSGQFLIDSEAKIREALAKMIRGDLASDQTSTSPVAGRVELDAQPDAMASALGELLDAYFAIGESLAGDSLAGIDGPARRISGAIDTLLATPIAADPHFWHRHDEAATIRGEAIELVAENSLAEARLAYADLSVALEKLVRATGIPADYEGAVEHLHCPMYREGQGGSSWLQPAGSVRNPFFGATMLGCFDERASLPRAPGADGESGAEASDGGRASSDESRRPSTGDPGRASGRTESERESLESESDAPEAQTAESAATEAIPAGPYKTLIAAYLALGESLAGDKVEGVEARLRSIHDAAAVIASAPRVPETIQPLAAAITRAAKNGDSASEIKIAREIFREISTSLIPLVGEAAPPIEGDASLFEIYCPMAKASWLDDARSVSNPYYGASMLRCGNVVRQVAGAKQGAEAKP